MNSYDFDHDLEGRNCSIYIYSKEPSPIYGGCKIIQFLKVKHGHSSKLGFGQGEKLLTHKFSARTYLNGTQNHEPSHCLELYLTHINKITDRQGHNEDRIHIKSAQYICNIVKRKIKSKINATSVNIT